MTPPPSDALALTDWFFQATGVGFAALDLLAEGVVPDDWTEAAECLAAAQDLLRETPPRLYGPGVVVDDADVAALARLRTLVGAGDIGDEARRLATVVRGSFATKNGADAA